MFKSKFPWQFAHSEIHSVLDNSNIYLVFTVFLDALLCYLMWLMLWPHGIHRPIVRMRKPRLRGVEEWTAASSSSKGSTVGPRASVRPIHASLSAPLAAVWRSGQRQGRSMLRAGVPAWGHSLGSSVGPIYRI